MLRPYTTPSPFQQLRELLRQLRADPRLLVLEEDESVAPGLPEVPHRAHPLLEVLLRVTFVAQPEVTKVRRGHERCRALLRVRDAQRGVPLPQHLVDLVRKPGLVAELPGTADVGWELGQQIA